MALETLVKRQSGKAHLATMVEGTDGAVLSDVGRTSSGSATGWNESSTTQLTLAGSAASACTQVDLGTGAAMTALNLGTGMGVGDAIAIGGSGSITTIGGDLVVDGTTTSTDSEVVNIADNHLYLNDGYTTASAQDGGIVVNYLPTATADTEAAGGFTAATTVATTGAATFAAGDFVQVSGAANQANDGIYEVLTHATNVLTIASSSTHSFCQTAFTVDATGSTASFTKVNVGVMQVDGSAASWQLGFGSTAAALTASLTGVEQTWAEVLATGNTSGTNNPTITSGQSLLGAAELTLASTGANTVSLDTGGAAAINIGGTNANDINIGAGGASVDIGTTSSGAVTINSASTIAIGDASAGAITADTAAGISLDAATSSNFTVTGASQTLTLAAAGGTANQVIVSSAGTGADAIDINATAGGIDIDANGAFDVLAGGVFSIDGTGASNVTATSGNLTLSTATSGNVIANAAGAIDIDAGTTVDILATTTFSIDGTGASNVSATSGTLTLSTITSGDVSIDAASSVVIDGAEAVADAVSITASDAAGGVDINAGTNGITLDATGGISLDASNTTASNFTSANTTAATSTTLTITVDNTGTGASNATLDINATSTTGSGVIDIDADDTITLDVLAGGTISIGADAVAMSVNIGTGGTGAKTVTIGDDTVTTSVTTIKSGGTGDITFDARGMTTPITLNQTGDLDLSGFTATSIIGALNELKSSGAATANLEDTFTAGETLALGDVVYISGNDTVSKAIATAESTANVMGVAEAAITSATTGQIRTDGAATVNAEDATYAAGDELFLSRTTAGLVTKTAPSTSGDVIVSVGFVRVGATISGGGTLSAQLVSGPKLTVG